MRFELAKLGSFNVESIYSSENTEIAVGKNIWLEANKDSEDYMVGLVRFLDLGIEVQGGTSFRKVIEGVPRTPGFEKEVRRLALLEITKKLVEEPEKLDTIIKNTIARTRVGYFDR